VAFRHFWSCILAPAHFPVWNSLCICLERRPLDAYTRPPAEQHQAAEDYVDQKDSLHLLPSSESPFQALMLRGPKVARCFPIRADRWKKFCWAAVLLGSEQETPSAHCCLVMNAGSSGLSLLEPKSRSCWFTSVFGVKAGPASGAGALPLPASTLTEGSPAFPPRQSKSRAPLPLSDSPSGVTDSGPLNTYSIHGHHVEQHKLLRMGMKSPRASGERSNPIARASPTRESCCGLGRRRSYSPCHPSPCRRGALTPAKAGTPQPAVREATRQRQPEPALSTVGAGQAAQGEAKGEDGARSWPCGCCKASISRGCGMAWLPRSHRERPVASPALLRHGPAPLRLPPAGPSFQESERRKNS